MLHLISVLAVCGTADEWAVTVEARIADSGKAVSVEFKAPSPGGEALNVIHEIWYARRDQVAELKLDFVTLARFKSSFERATGGDLEKKGVWHKIHSETHPIATYISTKEWTLKIPYDATPGRGKMGKVVPIEPRVEDFLLVVCKREVKGAWEVYAAGHTPVEKAGEFKGFKLSLLKIRIDHLTWFKAGGEHRKSMTFFVNNLPEKPDDYDWVYRWQKKENGKVVKEGQFKTQVLQGRCNTTFKVELAGELKTVTLRLELYKKGESKTPALFSNEVELDLNEEIRSKEK